MKENSTDRRLLAALLLFWIAVAGCASGQVPAIPETAVPGAPGTSAANPPAASTTTLAAKGDTAENSVVKIFCTARFPDVYKPWTKQSPTEVVGSGVVIDGKRILTCAHVVRYASQVQIRANEGSDRISAKVAAIAPGIDLAVLTLDDPSFFDSHPPLARATRLPDVRDSVLAYGYPQGGSSLSITRGIVSRIEYVAYNYPDSGLRIQIDAAINPGNSGGPAMVGDQMIGLAYSTLLRSQNIGYIIPCEEIETFLADIEDGHYDGKPTLSAGCQGLENPALRAYLNLDKSVEGVLVRKDDPATPPTELRDRDIITKIGDWKIDNQGQIRISPRLQVAFEYAVPKCVRNGKVPIALLRNGKPVELEVTVMRRPPFVFGQLEGGYPSYFIFGPVVFSSATMEYVGGLAGSFGAGALTILGITGSPLMTRLGDRPAFNGESMVVISSPFFPHRLARGYGNPLAQVVQKVNGIPIKNLRHLVEVLRDSNDEFISIEIAGHQTQMLVFPRKEMLTATDEILTDNDIRTQGSADTLAVWNAKTPAAPTPAKPR